ncbi:response regulator transcription factor [Ruficoccus amylovorans]|uniref:Response regulator transcription factor n=1 Tax=Ruficoccus amylovorans TaxID=1804625 RepID=A0A842HBH0_9BACT|nr:response regulator transcription factor [Ruficoccus amylovorans]MBC2592914.1 response regulator transcription factor [Ruficoccus amylovorans]
MTAPLTIALIDDEPAIRRLLRTALEGEHHRTVEAGNGADGLICVAQRQPDVVLLDLGLPDMDGLEVLDRLREWTDVPVIIITVRDEPEEKIAALDSGADDFITKPFHTGELLARIRSVCKRLHPAEQGALLEAGPLRIDFLGRVVSAGGHPVELTPTEYRILQTLARHHGKIVTKSTLLQQVWGGAGTTTDEHLRVHLAAIRKKLRVRGCDDLIQTETGVGYRLAARKS